jgi:hypothetical protein
LRLFSNHETEALVAAGTPPASAVDAFYHFLLPEMLGDPADAGGCKVVVSCLYAAEAAEALITWLFPLRNQIAICIALVQAKLI